jgi:hypothetical protein
VPVVLLLKQQLGDFETAGAKTRSSRCTVGPTTLVLFATGHDLEAEAHR